MVVPRKARRTLLPLTSDGVEVGTGSQHLPGGTQHLAVQTLERDLQGQSYLSEAISCVLQDFQGIVRPLTFAVEFDVARETFQFYLSKRERVTAPK